MLQEENKNRADLIHEKGFNIAESEERYRIGISNEFGKIKVNTKTLEDAILNLGSFKKYQNKSKPNLTNKGYIYDCINNNRFKEMREISQHFVKISGIYQRIVNYVSFLYRYDWYMSAEVRDDTIIESPDSTIKNYFKYLNFLDSSHIKRICGEIAQYVVTNGCYYGYIVPNKNGITLQELPPEYCRTRYKVNNRDAIEFNMQFFDTFSDIKYRKKVLNLFPAEFKKGYVLYKQGKLISDGVLDSLGSWYLLDVGSAVKFNINNSDAPMFINSIPAILDLDEAQDLDRKKQLQKLLKILVQKLPRDKNGDLIFDVDEARDIHNTAVNMLSRAVGVDVLTTFADVEGLNISDSSTNTNSDDLEKIERALYNSFGISQNLFNTDGNLSLNKSVLNDESSIRNLLFQFEEFYDWVLQQIQGKGQKVRFNFNMLETTQHNYQELSKLYKEQTQLGMSMLLPQIALGQAQTSILDSAKFENEVLNIKELMIPPMMSSTMNADSLLQIKNNKKMDKADQTTNLKNKNIIEDDNNVGRPSKTEEEKSDKTIANQESLS